MHIDKTQIHVAAEEMLGEISAAEFLTHSHRCPHCGLTVRYPTIARKQDLDDFEMIMKSAYRVMEKHGITANLLADIRADLHIRLAAKRTEPGKS